MEGCAFNLIGSSQIEQTVVQTSLYLPEMRCVAVGKNWFHFPVFKLIIDIMTLIFNALDKQLKQNALSSSAKAIVKMFTP